MTQLLPCPCCGYRTLSELGRFDLCTICWWEDDGQDNQDADVMRGGPNADQSLTSARVNFLRFGLFDPARSDLRDKQDDTDGIVQARRFVLSEDGTRLREVGTDQSWAVPGVAPP